MTPLQQKAAKTAIGLLESLKPGSAIPAERTLAERAGVGRTVIRGMLTELRRQRIIRRDGRNWILFRPVALAEFPDAGEEPVSKRQHAKNFLLAELGSGRLRPGDQLSELALAKRIGVATVSVREALLEMGPLGLLTKHERQKWEVAEFSETRISELREFREMVELFALRKLLAAPLSPERRASFESTFSKTKLLVSQSRPALKKMLRVDLDFHRHLLEATGNGLLNERAAFIYLIIEFQLGSPFYTVERGKRGLGQHLEILDAILARNLPCAEKALIAHLHAAEETFCAIVRESRKPSSARGGSARGR